MSTDINEGELFPAMYVSLVLDGIIADASKVNGEVSDG